MVQGGQTLLLVGPHLTEGDEAEARWMGCLGDPPHRRKQIYDGTWRKRSMVIESKPKQSLRL